MAVTRKPTHPIRRMHDGLARVNQFEPLEQRHDSVRLIARHVKPLLDALEREHAASHGGGCPATWDKTDCVSCRLLAAWRAKL